MKKSTYLLLILTLPNYLYAQEETNECPEGAKFDIDIGYNFNLGYSGDMEEIKYIDPTTEEKRTVNIREKSTNKYNFKAGGKLWLTKNLGFTLKFFQNYFYFKDFKNSENKDMSIQVRDLYHGLTLGILDKRLQFTIAIGAMVTKNNRIPQEKYLVKNLKYLGWSSLYSIQYNALVFNKKTKWPTSLHLEAYMKYSKLRLGGPLKEENKITNIFQEASGMDLGISLGITQQLDMRKMF